MLDSAIIAAINAVHDAFIGIDTDVSLDLPQIAVLGSQSSGKSSVLETFVGAEFLPRGSGIVTRCPLLLKLVRSNETFGEFAHKPGQRMNRFTDIRDEILRQTNLQCSGPRGISPQPISLTVGTPNMVPLTLVDLPGIVAQAMEGQSADIPAKIEEMVYKVVASPNTIILFVAEANHDLATNLALRILKRADPEGNRSVGVLTKMDLVSPGEDAMDIISGRIGKLKHGYIPVVNRSQANTHMTIEAGIEEERKFFLKHPKYSAIASRCGSQYLAKFLSGLLAKHIRSQPPRLEATLEAMQKRAQQEVDVTGGPSRDMDSRSLVLRMIKRFDDDLSSMLDGNVSLATSQLVGGARLQYVLGDCYGKFVSAVQLADVSDDVIRCQLRNSTGMQTPVFPSDNVIRTLVAFQLHRLHEPSGQCVDAVHNEMKDIIRECCLESKRFPAFRQEMLRICYASLQSTIPTALDHVKTFIDAEGSFVTFPRQATLPNPPTAPQPPTAPAPAQNQPQHGQAAAPPRRPAADTHQDIPRFAFGNPDPDTTVRQIRSIVEESFRIAQRALSEHVPKLIGLLVVNKFRKEIHEILIRDLYSSPNLDAMLDESPDVKQRRKAAEAVLQAVGKAREALRTLRQLSA